MNQLTVKKSHELVTARFHFSLQEMRLFCMVVGMIDDRDEDFKTYRIPIQEVIKTFGIKSNTIYEELKKLTDSMLHKIIVIPLKEDGKDKILKTTLMSSFKYNVDGRGVLEVTFHPALKPYLLQVKNRYLLYDIQNILRIGSPNSIRMYELLKSFEGIGKRSFDLQELKEILGVGDKYSKYSNFKRKIILKAQDDLAKHTDIVFSFEELSPSGGRKVEKLVFYISENRATKKKRPQDPILTEVEESSEFSSIEKKLAGFGLSRAVIKKQILSAFDVDYVAGTLKYCQAYFTTHQVESPWGFVLEALKNGYYKQEVKALKKKTSKKKWDRRSETLEKRVENQEHWNEKVVKLREQYQTDALIEDILSQKQGSIGYDFMLRDWKQGKVNKLLQGFIDRYLLQQQTEQSN